MKSICLIPCVQLVAAGVLCAGRLACGSGDDTEALIRVVRAVRAEGAGSPAAREARDRLAERGPEILPALLEGMDTPDSVAANWLRTVFDEVSRAAISNARESIPAMRLESYVLDPRRHGRPRRLALELLAKLDPTAPTRLILGLVDDPEFRSDAVALVIAESDRFAAEKDRDRAIAGYRRAFESARDVEQIRAAAAKLTPLGVQVDITAHLGFLVDWHIIGPFDGPEFKAFTTGYPPQRAVHLDETYDGQSGRVAWKPFRTSDELGTVDLIKALGPADDAAAYLFTTVQSPSDREAEIRCGADDNLSIWLNRELVFSKAEWQNGTRLDRFIVPVHLVRGRNELLVKVCQGPKYRDPGMANPWSLQMRICEVDGRGIRFQR